MLVFIKTKENTVVGKDWTAHRYEKKIPIFDKLWETLKNNTELSYGELCNKLEDTRNDHVLKLKCSLIREKGRFTMLVPDSIFPTIWVNKKK